MTVRVGYGETHGVVFPSPTHPGGRAFVEVRTVRRTPAMVRKRALNRVPDTRHLVERLRELALEAELAVNSLRLSGGASNTDGLAELRGTCLELAGMALLTPLAAAHEQAQVPALPARTEEER